VARGEHEKARRAGSCGAACTGSSGVASRGAEAAWVQPQGLAARNGRGPAVAQQGAVTAAANGRGAAVAAARPSQEQRSSLAGSGGRAE